MFAVGFAGLVLLAAAASTRATTTASFVLAVRFRWYQPSSSRKPVLGDAIKGSPSFSRSTNSREGKKTSLQPSCPTLPNGNHPEQRRKTKGLTVFGLPDSQPPPSFLSRSFYLSSSRMTRCFSSTTTSFFFPSPLPSRNGFYPSLCFSEN